MKSVSVSLLLLWMALASMGCVTTSTIQLPRNWEDYYFDLAADKSATSPTLAVLPFVTSEQVKEGGDLNIGEIVVTALTRSGRFTMVERSRINEVIGEQNFSNSDRVDPNTAVAMGKLLGASTVVFGSLSSASQQKIDKFAYDVVHTEVRLDVRAADTTTGRVLFSETANGTSETKIVTDSHGTRISGAVDTKSEYIAAARQAVEVLEEKLIRQFPVVGFVISVDQDKVVTDVGANKELAMGKKMVVVRPVERIIHPATKKAVGWKKAVLALGEVKSVEASTSTMKIIRRPQEADAVRAGDMVVVSDEQ